MCVCGRGGEVIPSGTCIMYFSFVQIHQPQSMLGVHASAQAIIHFGKIARKHILSGVCLDSLSRSVDHDEWIFILVKTLLELRILFY